MNLSNAKLSMRGNIYRAASLWH